VIRLILTPSTSRPGQYEARREDTGVHVVSSHQPLCDGSRELILRGEDPETLITLRHASSTSDSFEPWPMSWWADKTYEEGPSTPLRRRKYRPYPAGVANGAGREVPFIDVGPPRAPPPLPEPMAHQRAVPPTIRRNSMRRRRP
jgi:hypothetical protein